MTRNHLILAGHSAVLLGCLALVALRLAGPDMRRPFDTDELLTVRYYTWAGTHPSGEHRPLPHIDDFHALQGPEPIQWAMGLYCAAGRWPEPNNHVVNSLLVNVALAAGARDERWARLPALLGAAAFVVALYVLCAAALGWRAAAPLAVVWAWFLPYTVVYSQSARGFTWMMALQAMMILLAYLLARRPGSLALGALAAAAAAMSLMNVVSMAVDWVLPYYLALYFVRPSAPGASIDAPATEGPAWRRAVLVQALVVAAVGGVFFVSRLPSLYSSARQYGLTFHGPGEFFERAGEVLDGLFPDFWSKALALVGGGGLVGLWFDRRHRFLAVLAAVVVGVSLAHYLAGGRFPYARAAGHLVPLVLLGAAYAAQRVVEVYESARGRALMFAALALVSAGLAAASEVRLQSPSLDRCLALSRQVTVPAGTKVFLPLRATAIEYLVAAYGPREWQQVEAVHPGDRLAILLIDTEKRAPKQDAGLLDPSRFRLTRVIGPTRALPESGAVPRGAWVFWYPDFTRLGLDGREQMDYVAEVKYPYLTLFTRSPVRFDIHSHLQGALFHPGPDADFARLAEAVREAIRRFGGRAVVFVPEDVQTVR